MRGMVTSNRLAVKKSREAAKNIAQCTDFFAGVKLISIVDSNEVKTTQTNQTYFSVTDFPPRENVRSQSPPRNPRPPQ
jgi:hypothetical protein